MSTIDIDPQLSVIGGGNTTPPPAPTIAYLIQSGDSVQATIQLPTTTGSLPIVALRLYSGGTNAGPWTQVDEQANSEISALNNLYDEDPSFGVETFYAATALDSDLTESAMSAVLSIAPTVLS